MVEKNDKGDVYSNFKVAHHMGKIEQLKKGNLITPVFVQWDITNTCNLACNFCFYRINKLSDFNPLHSMSKNTIFRVLEELKEMGVKAIEWTGGGEPTLHENFREIIPRAKELGFEQALVTNGTLLNDETINLIKDFEWVRFSIDASTQETYLQIKGVHLFNKAIENMGKLLKVKDESNIVGFSFIVCPDNYREILEACLLAKKMGCDNIRFSLAMTPSREKMFDDIWDKVTAEIELAKNEETMDFRVFAFSNRINELSLEVLSDYCGYHHFVGVIAPSGVYPCCRLKDDGRYNFGNLESHTFRQTWYGQKRKNFIKRISKGCPYDCWMTRKNQFIKYLMSKTPPHMNFV